MEQQDQLRIRNVREALKQGCYAIAAAAGPQAAKAWAKYVGSILWPDKDPEDAGTYLNNCLDKDRNREKLDLDQAMWIVREAKRVGCHIPMAFICDYAEYQRTTPIATEDEAAELQRQFVNAMRIASELTARMEQLQQGAKPAVTRVPSMPRP